MSSVEEAPREVRPSSVATVVRVRDLFIQGPKKVAIQPLLESGRAMLPFTKLTMSLLKGRVEKRKHKGGNKKNDKTRKPTSPTHRD